MVKKHILTMRAAGVMAIDGTQYYDRMAKPATAWHFNKTDGNFDSFPSMFEDCLNAAYAVIPYGFSPSLNPLQFPGQGRKVRPASSLS